ncbi:hypothetical protein A9Q95_03435 [Rhodobacterales bacterium 59_46_T64]|nr:hypothetical protein A9Q95_03435 [Rhodobacterales bacterium 59_46_T64]
MTLEHTQIPRAGRTELDLLTALGLIDAPRDPAVDALTRLACDLLDVPIAMISFFDDHQARQYIKSQHGFPVDLAGTVDIPYTHSACIHMKGGDAPLVVSNAQDDDRIKDNPVVNAHGLRAYLGVPVYAPGGAIWGSFCVLDGVPRDWNADDERKITDLALCVSREVALLAGHLDGQEAQAETQQMQAGLKDQAEAQERIMRSFMRAGQSIEERFAVLLRDGAQVLGMESGRIARVCAESADILASFDHGVLSEAGQRAAADSPVRVEGTYAAQLLTGQDRLVLPDCTAQPLSRRTCLGGTVAGRYLGAPLAVEGVSFGVLEFTGAAPRPDGWRKTELALFDYITVVAMAHLEIFKHIKKLRASEAAIVSTLLDQREAARRAAVAPSNKGGAEAS